MGKKGTPRRKFSKEEKMAYICKNLFPCYRSNESMMLKFIGIQLSQAVFTGRRSDFGASNDNPYAALHTSKNLTAVERLCLLIAK